MNNKNSSSSSSESGKTPLEFLSENDTATASQELTSLPPASGPGGRSITLSTRVPVATLSAIRIIVESDQTPYENNSAFVRAALQKHIIELAATVEGSMILPPIVTLLKRWGRETYQTEIYQMLLKTFAEVAKGMEYYLKHGNIKRASRELEEVCDDILKLKDSFWRQRGLEELFKFQVVRDCLEADLNVGERTAEAHRIWSALQE